MVGIIPTNCNKWPGTGMPHFFVASCPHHCYRAPPEAVSGRAPFLADGTFAGVAELVDAAVLGTAAERRGGSSPSARTRTGRAHRVRREFSRAWAIPGRIDPEG